MSGSPETVFAGGVGRAGDVVACRTLFAEVHLFSHPWEVREALVSHHVIRTPLVKAALGDAPEALRRLSS